MDEKTIGTGESIHKSSGDGDRCKKHGDEEQATTKKYGGEKTIFQQTNVVAEDSHKPQERNPRKWNEIQWNQDPLS